MSLGGWYCFDLQMLHMDGHVPACAMPKPTVYCCFLLIFITLGSLPSDIEAQEEDAETSPAAA